MCKARTCTELGNDPTTWSTQALLPPPQWFRDQLQAFSSSVRAAAEGCIDTAIALLQTVRSDDLRDWFVEHGAQSGRIRSQRLGLNTRTVPDVGCSNREQTKASLQRIVLDRDGYRCRYCGIELIPKKVLVDFGDVLGINAFRARTDAGRHGALVAFRANFDHVEPAARRGATDLSNLVSCCWTCNYGKRALTLSQVGLEDPRLREARPIPGWDGLMSIAPSLALAASRARRAARQQSK